MIFFVNFKHFSIQPFKACCFIEFPIILDIAHLKRKLVIFITEARVAIFNYTHILVLKLY